MTKRRSWLIGLGVVALVAVGAAITFATGNSDEGSSTDQAAEGEAGQQPLDESSGADAGELENEGDQTTDQDSTDETTTDDTDEPVGDPAPEVDEIEPESGDPEQVAAITSGSGWQPVLECVNGLVIQSDGTDWRIEELGMEAQPLDNGEVPRRAMVELCGAEPTEEDLQAQAEAIESLAYELTLLGPITFDPGSTTLSGDSSAVLNTVAELLKAQPGALIEVAGHADSRGSASDNLLLSEQRAEAIVFELEERGVLNELVPIGRGEDVLRQTNEDDAVALSQNRRIELRVIL